jgi:major membrane immunogen (membrane-anchored lipoprotein)
MPDGTPDAHENDSDERGWKAYLGHADDGGDEALVFSPNRWESVSTPSACL